MLLLAYILCLNMNAQVKREIIIPDICGFMTLKCDFHSHSVFSDGMVWPTVRVDEAWREGLDALSLTEHIEYRPHKKYITEDRHDQSYEIAKSYANDNNIILIKGSEISRSMPPGHFNAIFLEDCKELDQKDWREAFKAAKKQNAFIFWNHPGWARQQPDTTLWWKEHTEIYNNGWMQGIEVANSGSYFPEAHRWCLDKNLTMLGNSDIHQPIGMDYNFYKGEHRTMTFVLVKERTIEGIREALDNHRTLVYIKNLVIGKEEFIKDLFEKSVKVTNIKRNKNNCQITLQNNSDLKFELTKSKHNMEIEYFRTFTINPQSRCVINIYYPEGFSNKGEINFKVSNLLVRPNEGLEYSYSF